MTDEPLDDEPRLIDVELGRIVLRDHSVAAPQYIYLREQGGERSFPIVIGFPEAHELQRVVTGVRTERPMTHQLLLSAIETLGARVGSVEIVDVQRNTFFARIRLVDGEGNPLAELDARPSDSIALATRARCPIRVSEAVLEAVRTDEAPDALPDGGQTEDEADGAEGEAPGF